MRIRQHIGVRWTIGDVSPRGFEALRLSLWGAWKIFGPNGSYAVTVNTISVAEARMRAGPVPGPVSWMENSGSMPDFLKRRLHPNMAEGVGWKLAPLRLFPDRHEISLDNDCILWELPPTIAQWLASSSPRLCLMAEDVKSCFGQFAELCGSQSLNSGIRGLPPGFDLQGALESVLQAREKREGKPVVLCSETDEQGMQAAALSAGNSMPAVTTREVSICSPFFPHQPDLGTCGAHFVGLNARHIPWNYYGQPADECEAEHWERHRPALYRLTGAPGFHSS